ncbi:cysteine and histidine-rich domain-containing protein 1-like [Oscarella lobularis]|uniref:cysteine and histidine-rich domain-containing protein 1-like n=1 Tax=Oscarella lobularis TaxID=121494 RepID=UPI0033142293
MAEVDLNRCYNRGCGKTYSDDDNHEKACRFHPGDPFFHDAYKGWNCCQKKSVDFTEFLNIPGCTVSFHSNVKPPEAEKPAKEKAMASGEVLSVGTEKRMDKSPIEREERPSDDLPMMSIKSSVGSTLKSALTRFKAQANDQGTRADVESKPLVCTNRGCGKSQLDVSDEDVCVYHPGFPIFHEGMKYWSCCQHKTSDFDQFLKQKECAKGDHKWASAKEAAKILSPCRYDFFQSGGWVTLCIYAKNALPDETRFDANSTVLKAHVVYEFGQKSVDYSWNLFGVIDPQKSSASLLGTKIELKLKKASATNWRTLEHRK